MPVLLLGSLATWLLAQPAAALNADYWRGGWRTPLGESPHIYEFVIRGSRVSGVYCRNCSDATTIGFIDGTWDERAGIKFTVTFANQDGRITSVDDQQATLVDGRMLVTGAANVASGKLTLIKDPRGADPGGAPAYHLPPGTPPALPAPRATGAGPAGGGGGGGAGRGGAPLYWQAGPFKALKPADLVGTWIASFGLGMNRQLFTFLLVGNQLRGVVCGRCDNPYTTGAMENIRIVGDTLYFDIVHEDWGEVNPPTFVRHIAAQLVQNELLAGILPSDIDPARPPARPTGRGGFTLTGPIAPSATKGNTSEGIDVWGPGTGSSVEPPPGRTPLRQGNVAAADRLQIYFIDVEGGQATLIVTPQRHAILVDAGFPGNRDADRVLAAARDAGVSTLDYLLVTHFHQDHLGGVPEVARQLPVSTFIDYGQPLTTFVPEAVWTAYTDVRGRGRQLHPQPGDDLVVDGVQVDFASAGGALATTALAGATRTTDVSCAPVQRGAGDEGENPRSYGFRLRFGQFSFLDLGDLPGVNLAALVCPKNLLGHSDVFLVPHHGNADTAFPFVVAAVSPRVAILNNGVAKGGDPRAFEMLRAARLEDVWQLHRSNAAAAANFADAFVVNLTAEPDAGAWLKLTAERDGSFSITNGRTHATKTYAPRR